MITAQRLRAQREAWLAENRPERPSLMPRREHERRLQQQRAEMQRRIEALEAKVAAGGSFDAKGLAVLLSEHATKALLVRMAEAVGVSTHGTKDELAHAVAASFLA
ncbi:MAG: hypothetical protein AAGA56_19190 [Myxococcota bacterium]